MSSPLYNREQPEPFIMEDINPRQNRYIPFLCHNRKQHTSLSVFIRLSRYSFTALLATSTILLSISSILLRTSVCSAEVYLPGYMRFMFPVSGRVNMTLHIIHDAMFIKGESERSRLSLDLIPIFILYY